MIEGLQFISGPSGSGKTTFCLSLLERAAELGVSTGGFISPPVFRTETKIGIDLLNVWSGEQRRLANLIRGNPEGVYTRKWQFDEKVIGWGNRFLAERLPCDVLFMDEIGPVELERGEGLLEAAAILDERAYDNIMLVVRPHLLDYARERWPWGHLNTVLE